MSQDARRPWVSEIGVAIALGAAAILFAAMLLTHAAARNRSAAWPPPDLPTVPLSLGALASAVLVASAIALGGRGAARWRGALAALLGAGFVALQLATLVGLWRDGWTPAGGPVASSFVANLGLHAALAAVAAAALALAPRPGLWVWVWRFVVAVWLVAFGFLYLGHGG